MVSDEQLLEDLREFADELGKTPTETEMRKKGPWHGGTYQNHFGSWNNALQQAGLKVNQTKEIPESKERLLDDLREFANKLGKTPTAPEMDKKGQWSGKTYHNHFGSWNDALQEVGLEINKENDVPESKEQLLDDLREFADGLKKTPTAAEMNDKGPWDEKVYRNQFGSWNNAVQEAGLEINCLGPSERAGIGEDAYGEGYKEKRSEVLELDKYKCRVCGKTEDLHCHHIKPRRTFDDVSDSNTLDNLITLCASCHRTFEGKWTDASPSEFERKAKQLYTSSV